MRLLLALLLLPSLAANAGESCQDDFCRGLQRAGLSPRAYRLLGELIKAEHYAKPYAAIADYSLPSGTPRLFVLNLAARSFKAYFVSHGMGSGGQDAVLFGNTPNLKQSALGFMRTSPHSGKFGNTLLLTGLSKSNSRLTPGAAILIHCAEYSSKEFYKIHGFWGRSEGCLAVPCEDIPEILSHLGSGALVLGYHEALWDQSLANPLKQEIGGHDAIPPPTRWELDENAHGIPGGPYKTKYGHEPFDKEN